MFLHLITKWLHNFFLMLQLLSLSSFRISKGYIMDLCCTCSLCLPSYVSTYTYTYIWVLFAMCFTILWVCACCVSTCVYIHTYVYICMCYIYIYIYIYIYMRIFFICLHMFLWACRVKVRCLSFLFLGNRRVSSYFSGYITWISWNSRGLSRRNGFCNLTLLFLPHWSTNFADVSFVAESLLWEQQWREAV